MQLCHSLFPAAVDLPSPKWLYGPKVTVFPELSQFHRPQCNKCGFMSLAQCSVCLQSELGGQSPLSPLWEEDTVCSEKGYDLKTFLEGGSLTELWTLCLLSV